MNCPKCSYPNPQAATHCNMCFEVFNRSAAARYMHAQKRARFKRDGSLPPEEKESDDQPQKTDPVKETANVLLEKLKDVPWSAIFTPILEQGRATFQKYPKHILSVVALIILLIPLVFYTSAERRIKIFGRRLDYHFVPNSATPYLVNLHSEIRGWSERGGRLDTPMDTIERDETGNVDLLADKFNGSKQLVRLKPREWIVNQKGEIAQNLMLSHPSLKPSFILLTRDGAVSPGEPDLSARSGRLLTFLTPHWPKGSQRAGNQWSEPIQWVEVIGDWKILWKGRLHWTLKGLSQSEGSSILHLVYTADVTPSIWSVPEWAKGGVRTLLFKGRGTGDLLFDTRTNRVDSNDFLLKGEFTIPIDNIYRIPDNLRVGRTPRRRWGRPAVSEPGLLKIEINNSFEVRKA